MNLKGQLLRSAPRRAHGLPLRAWPVPPGAAEPQAGEARGPLRVGPGGPNARPAEPQARRGSRRHLTSFRFCPAAGGPPQASSTSSASTGSAAMTAPLCRLAPIGGRRPTGGARPCPPTSYWRRRRPATGCRPPIR